MKNLCCQEHREGMLSGMQNPRRAPVGTAGSGGVYILDLGFWRRFSTFEGFSRHFTRKWAVSAAFPRDFTRNGRLPRPFPRHFAPAGAVFKGFCLTPGPRPGGRRGRNTGLPEWKRQNPTGNPREKCNFRDYPTTPFYLKTPPPLALAENWGFSEAFAALLRAFPGILRQRGRFSRVFA